MIAVIFVVRATQAAGRGGVFAEYRRRIAGPIISKGRVFFF